VLRTSPRCTPFVSASSVCERACLAKSAALALGHQHIKDVRPARVPPARLGRFRPVGLTCHPRACMAGVGWHSHWPERPLRACCGDRPCSRRTGSHARSSIGCRWGGRSRGRSRAWQAPPQPASGGERNVGTAPTWGSRLEMRSAGHVSGYFGGAYSRRVAGFPGPSPRRSSLPTTRKQSVGPGRHGLFSVRASAVAGVVLLQERNPFG
jgi:hypothetical protein